MNLIEKLIRIDKEKFAEKETKKIKSANLSKVLGEDAEITIQALSGRKLSDLMQFMVDKNGNRDLSRLYDANLMYCVEGIIEPDLKDQRLKDHFGAKTPKDLCAILFDAEAGKIADEIVHLSGVGEKEEEEVKN